MRFFVAPSLIVHYVVRHQYDPPLVFQAAVLECPPMKGQDYMSFLEKGGLILKGPPPGVKVVDG